MINALSILKQEGIECRCKLVGEGESKKYLKTLVERHSLRNNVIFLGNRSDVPELLAKACIFVLPSRWEGFGIAIIEAMAAGVPVIASKIDGPKEIITHGKNGLLFESGNVTDLAEKIKMLFNNGNLRKKLANNAFFTVQEYSVEKMHNRYLSLYNELLRSKDNDAKH